MEMDWILIVGMYAGGTFVSLQNCFIRNTFELITFEENSISFMKNYRN